MGELAMLTSLELLATGEGLTLTSVRALSGLTGLTSPNLKVTVTDESHVIDMVSSIRSLKRLESLRLDYLYNVCYGISALSALPALKTLNVEASVINCVDSDNNIHNPLARLTVCPALRRLDVIHYVGLVYTYIEDFEV